MRKIGIFAGTFDPIHEGHVAFANACVKDLSLSKVLFLPEPQPRHKKGVGSLSVRTKQIEERLKTEKPLSLLQLNEQQFNIQTTLPQLHALYPESTLYLLLGSDVALYLNKWKDIQVLLEKMDLAIGMRERHTEEEVHLAMSALANSVNTTPRYTLHQTKFSHFSSSQLKNK